MASERRCRMLLAEMPWFAGRNGTNNSTPDIDAQSRLTYYVQHVQPFSRDDVLIGPGDEIVADLPVPILINECV